MMTVIAIDRAFVMDRLNRLPPHSRHRSGYCDLLRHMNRMEMQAETEQMRQSDDLGRVLAEALDMELRAEFGTDWPRVEEAW